MFNLSEIRKKRKYVIERLNRVTDEKEKEKLELSLLAYYNILEASGSIRYTRFYNFLDMLTENEFSLKKEHKYDVIADKIFAHLDYIDEEYLEFLTVLATNVANGFSYEDICLEFLKTNHEENINVSKSFYRNLGNSEILKISNKILNDSQFINFSNVKRNNYDDFSAMTCDDYVFDKSYITIINSNSIFDYQMLNHEVMHAIDFKIKQKLPSENYYGFHEIPTYTIDYLFIDFLENIGFDFNEVEKLKKQKSDYLRILACLTLTDLRSQMSLYKAFEKRDKTNKIDKSKFVSQDIIRKLLEIESGVIAYILYNKIKENKEYGINCLIKLMKTNIPKDSKPDFSFIDISDELILENSSLVSEFLNEKNKVNKK